MKKVLILTILLISLTFSKTFDFLQQNFNAEITEFSEINNKKKKKIYNLEYKPNIVKFEVLEPKLNSGEIITYSSGKKTLYSPKLKQTIEQKLSFDDTSLYSILEELSNMDQNSTYEVKNKKYIFENKVLVEIIADKYKIKFREYIDNKPRRIQYVSNYANFEYLIKY
ncbi:hypothetical protein [Streptobacillus notomytis]|uniref:hypothetical protein n=1 Tax=Streptobacillus notomytis TaxID=1712031 RepID=UPI00082F6E60|nr:hypothetical protein [Streptobacillus notomytis]